MAFPEPVVSGGVKSRVGEFTVPAGATWDVRVADLILAPRFCGLVGVAIETLSVGSGIPVCRNPALPSLSCPGLSVEVRFTAPGGGEQVLFARMGEMVPVSGSSLRVSVVHTPFYGHTGGAFYMGPAGRRVRLVPLVEESPVLPVKTWIASTFCPLLSNDYPRALVPPRAVAFRILGCDLTLAGGWLDAEFLWGGGNNPNTESWFGSGLWPLAVRGYWVPIGVPQGGFMYGKSFKGVQEVFIRHDDPAGWPLGDAQMCAEWLCQ